MLSFNVSSISPLVDIVYQWHIGFFIIGVVALIFFVNFLLMLRQCYNSIWKIYWNVQKYFRKRKLKAEKKKLKPKQAIIELVKIITKESVREIDLDVLEPEVRPVP